MDFTYEHRYDDEPSVAILVRSLVTGKEVVLDEAVDTGSNVTEPEGWVATALELDLDSADISSVAGVGGIVREVALAEVVIEVFLRQDLKAVVFAAFLPLDAPPIGNLLGTDVLESIDFALSHAHKTLYFGLPA